jgi:hypothetical protein
MKTPSMPYPIYDLSNTHFKHVEILTSKNEILKGQFVRFRVLKSNDIVYIYPSEKYCFLPEDNMTLFWDTYKANDGEFDEFPLYIKQFGLNDIAEITIKPLLSL